MPTFFQNSGIHHWLRLSRSTLFDALERSRRARQLHHLDLKVIRPEWRRSLAAANTSSRALWGEAICQEFAQFFCDGGDGSTHSHSPLWATLCDQQCVRRRDQRLTDDDLARIKRRLRIALYGLNYVAIIEPAYYVNWQDGYGPAKSATCVAWHLHALVWGISANKLNERLRASKRKNYYRRLAHGLRPTHVKIVKQGGLPRVVAYMVKWPRSTYRVTKSVAAKSCKFADETRSTRLSYRFNQQSSKLRPGEVITYLTLLRNLRLNDLTFAGGKGTALLLAVRRALEPRDNRTPVKNSRKRRRRFCARGRASFKRIHPSAKRRSDEHPTGCAN